MLGNRFHSFLKKTFCRFVHVQLEGAHTQTSVLRLEGCGLELGVYEVLDQVPLHLLGFASAGLSHIIIENWCQ